MKRYLLYFMLFWSTVSCSSFLEEYSQDLSKVESVKDLDELLIGDGYWHPGRVYVERSVLHMDDPCLMALHLMSDETEVYRKVREADMLGIQNRFFGWITWQRQVGTDFENSAVRSEDMDWNELYRKINVVNQVIADIDGLGVSGEKEALDRIRVKGEASFLRAFYYFTLVNIYARPYDPETASVEPGVPLKLSRKIEDKEFVSAPLTEVYTDILQDLQVARECLAQTPVRNHPYRADIVAAELLTSRVCLYMQDWEQALEYAEKVLERKNGLENLNSWKAEENAGFLNRQSVETVFSMGGHMLAPALYSTNGTNAWGQELKFPAYTISGDLVGLYGPAGDDNDLRRGIYIREMTPVLSGIPSMPVWVFGKVDGPTTFQKGTTPYEVGDFFLMRTAEAYLNAAEAAAQLGRTEVAARYLHLLRSNRVKEDSGSYGDNLISFVRDERERELCLEGHRWFDLRRYMVDGRYPYSKGIVHYYTDFNTEIMNPDGAKIFRTLRYELEPDDPAYTLALPREVTEFQNTLPSVSRPERRGTVTDD